MPIHLRTNYDSKHHWEQTLNGAEEIFLLVSGLSSEDEIKLNQWWKTLPAKGGEAWNLAVNSATTLFPDKTQDKNWGVIFVWNRRSGCRFLLWGSATILTLSQTQPSKILIDENQANNSEASESYVPWTEAGEIIRFTLRQEHQDYVWDCSAPKDQPPTENQSDEKNLNSSLAQFQSGWDDLFTYGISTGSLWRKAGSGEVTDISEWNARLGWYLLSPILQTYTWWSKLPKNKRSAGKLGLVSLGLFSSGLFFNQLPSNLQNTNPIPWTATRETERRKIIEQQNAAEQALIYADRTRAAALLAETKSLLENLPLSTDLVATQNKLQAMLANIETRIDEKILLQNIGSAVDVAVLGNRMLWLGQDQSIRWYDLTQKKLLATVGAGAPIVGLDCQTGQCYVLTTKRLLQLDINPERSGQWTKEWSIPKNWPNKVIGFRIYRNNLYLGTQNGNNWQIWKSFIGGRNLGRPTAWNSPQPGRLGDFSVSVEITAYIWPMGNEGLSSKEQWLSGKRLSKRLLDFSGPLAFSAQKISQSAKGEIWLDPPNQRLLVIPNNGPVKQVIKSGWDQSLNGFLWNQRIVLMLKDSLVSVSWPDFSGE